MRKFSSYGPIIKEEHYRLLEDERVDVLKLNLEHLKMTDDVVSIINDIAYHVSWFLKLPRLEVTNLKQFYPIFTPDYLPKPLILILDEFDALHPEVIERLFYEVQGQPGLSSWFRGEGDFSFTQFHDTMAYGRDSMFVRPPTGRPPEPFRLFWRSRG